MIDPFFAAQSMCGAINPHIQAGVRISTGLVVNNDGSITPQYASQTLEIEVQALRGGDLVHAQSLGLQGDMRIVYVKGAVRALNRDLQIGGDILHFLGSDWLVTRSLEEWGDGEWCKILVTRQISPPA